MNLDTRRLKTLGDIRTFLAGIAQFDLQRVKAALSARVVIAITRPAHAANEFSFDQQILVIVRTVPTAWIL